MAIYVKLNAEKRRPLATVMMRAVLLLLIFELSGDDGEEAELLPVDDEALLDAVFEEFCRVAEEEEAAAEAEELQ